MVELLEEGGRRLRRPGLPVRQCRLHASAMQLNGGARHGVAAATALFAAPAPRLPHGPEVAGAQPREAVDVFA
jgi:hypothetical protein